jgi:hypothetical protein
MGKRLSEKRWFGVMWVITNIIGFLIGSILGATDNGLVSRVMGAGIVPHVLGDLVFGACFGIAQWWVLQRFFPKSRPHLVWWIPACMIGFMLGARLGARFAPLAGESDLVIGIAFGILMGSSLGIVQWLSMQTLGTLKTVRPALWIPASILAWVLGESIAFQFRFGLAGVPLVALAIALVSGIALL